MEHCLGEDAVYTKVEFDVTDGEARFVLSGEPEETESGPHVSYHEIPLYAIANRMELYGLESVEQTLEYMGREVQNPETADTLHGLIHEAYSAVVQAEYAQTLMPVPKVDVVERQTLMEPMAIGGTRRQKLQQVRSDSLAKIQMRSVIHSEPMSRVLDTSRPVERTRPAAAAALDTTEEVIDEAVRLVQENLEEVKTWRGHTLLSYTPQLVEKLNEG